MKYLGKIWISIWIIICMFQWVWFVVSDPSHLNSWIRIFKFFYITLKNSGTPWFRDFSFILSSTFVYEPIMLKISMNANIVKTQIFYKFKYDLKGHSRLQTMTFLFKKSTFVIDWLKKKIDMNANINMQIFHLIRHDNWRSQKVTFMFILILTYVRMDNFLFLFGYISPWIYSKNKNYNRILDS